RFAMLRCSLVLLTMSVAVLPLAAQEAGKYDGKTLQEWVALLKHKDAFERQNAAFALGHMKFQAKEAVPPRIESIKADKEANVRAEVADSLGRLGYSARDAMPTLLETIKMDKDVGVRAAAVLAAGYIGATNKDVVPALVDALKDKETLVR